jgi:NTP pyrophosphatase (non-canonical NTP hydrolase)
MGSPQLPRREEVGELSHAFLKFHQGIRGYDEGKFMNEACDAVGDIVIYLASFCNANGIELDFVVWDTWQTVKSRDWVADPQKGGT